jgi:two-component system, chemotaxis family, protein-glutamate methylesterase/glutaminase
MRVMVIDDAALYRELVAGIALRHEGVSAVDTAGSAAEALQKMAGRPADVVFCDIYMPGMDGVQALSEIQARSPAAQVVMMSSVSTRSAETTIRALQMGALDFIRKPDGASPLENEQRLTRDVQAQLRLAAIRLNTARARAAVSDLVARTPAPLPRPPTAPPVAAAHAVAGPFSVVLVGVSTGGPEALIRLLPELPATFPLPILIVQHMPAGFTAALAASLDRRSLLRVREVAGGEVVRPGVVYVAPGGRHMVVERSGVEPMVRVTDDAPEHGCRPAVDVLFRSAAEAYAGQGTVAVVLTGMGEDGAAGVRALKSRGRCLVLAQSAETCVVFGMPRAVAEAGLADRVLPLDQIAGELCRRAGIAEPARGDAFGGG